MFSERYGDLERIAALTDGDCHLCHEPADLRFYGRTGRFGDDTVTVDHLRPQHHGGTDRRGNLRLAHGTCNSIRGTRHASEVRLELAGTAEAPMSASEKALWSIGGGAVAALVAGYAKGQLGPDGKRQFNPNAALAWGLLFAVGLRIVM